MQLDYVIRNCRSRQDTSFGDRAGACEEDQKQRMAASVDRPVPDLLRPDDHADRGAGQDNRVAARIDSRVIPRQHRTVGD